MPAGSSVVPVTTDDRRSGKDFMTRSPVRGINYRVKKRLHILTDFNALHGATGPNEPAGNADPSKPHTNPLRKNRRLRKNGRNTVCIPFVGYSKNRYCKTGSRAHTPNPDAETENADLFLPYGKVSVTDWR